MRTQDEFFNRMIVVDRRVAIIPSPDDLQTALAIREPTIVAYLVDVFMRSWERARPFTSQEASVVKHIADEQRAMTMRMLIEGHSDPVSAKRLGVSPRTYAGYVADLKDEFDAETRFQLGYSIGRLEPASADRRRRRDRRLRAVIRWTTALNHVRRALGGEPRSRTTWGDGSGSRLKTGSLDQRRTE